MNCSQATIPPDETLMSLAIELARNGRGATAPNPCVGAVLARKGVLLAQGWHTACGKPHAERECLAQAQETGVFDRVDASECTLYVTLEPCDHHGRTPPCTDAILEAGIGRVVIGAMDPNKTAAGGAQRLRENNVEVVTGILERECTDLIADFLIWQQTDRPFSILKLATTLDGKIASAACKPEPVSCPESFSKVHTLRAMSGAIIVGGGTFRADDPSLTCRMETLPGGFAQPLAVVVTGTLPSPDADRKLLRNRPDQLIFWTGKPMAQSPSADALREKGIRVLGLPELSPGVLDFTPGFIFLRQECGCLYTLCEGGGTLAMRLVEQGLADELVQFVAPRILGDNTAPSAFSGKSGVSMGQCSAMRIIRSELSGTDVMLTLHP